MHFRWFYIVAFAALLVLGGVGWSDIRSVSWQPDPPARFAGSVYVSGNPHLPSDEADAVPAESAVAGEAVVAKPAPLPGRPPSEYLVRFTDDGYVPAELTIRRGDAVTFTNESYGLLMWPASDPEPEHSGYPGIGSCGGGPFDACGRVPVSGAWSFTFTRGGVWRYHDHVNTIFTGAIVVD